MDISRLRSKTQVSACNSTEICKYIWSLKGQRKDHKIEFYIIYMFTREILQGAKRYSNKTKMLKTM